MTALNLHYEAIESLHPAPTTPAEIAAARRLAHHYATDAADERALLGMLGVAA